MAVLHPVPIKALTDIAERLGLENVLAIDLHFSVRGVATADVKMALTVDQGAGIEEVLRRYELREIGPEATEGAIL